jgi:hypothetical protein
MCLVLNDKFKKLIAERPILCYKYGSSKSKYFTPPFRDLFRYELNKETERIYINPVKAFIHNTEVLMIEKGYHSYIKSNIITDHVFIIPKGAEYYIGRINDYYEINGYVSSSLIWLGNRNSIATWFRFLKHKFSKK